MHLGAFVGEIQTLAQTHLFSMHWWRGPVSVEKSVGIPFTWS